MCSACGFSLPVSSVLHPVRMICLKSRMNFNRIFCCKMMPSACSLLLFLRRAIETWTYMFWSFMISSGHNSGGYQYGQRVCFSALWICQSLHATVSHDPRLLDERQVLGSVEWKRTILFYLKVEPIPISQLSFYLPCTSVTRKCLTSCQGCKSKTSRDTRERMNEIQTLACQHLCKQVSLTWNATLFLVECCWNSLAVLLINTLKCLQKRWVTFEYSVCRKHSAVFLA